MYDLIDSDKIEELFKRGHINQSTYDKLKSDDLSSPEAPVPPAPSEDYQAALRYQNRNKPNLVTDSAAPETNAPVPQNPLQKTQQDILGNYERGINQQQGAIQESANNASEKANAESKLLDEGMKKLDQIEADRIEREEERQKFVQGKVGQLDSLADSVGKTNVEAKDFWANASTGNKILMGISLFLGSFGPGEDNKVVKMMMDAVDRDVSLQKYNLDHKKDILNAKSNNLKQMREIFKDERLAEDALKISALEKIKIQTMQKAAQYSAPEVQANAKNLIGQLEVKKGELKQNFIKEAEKGGLTFAQNFKLEQDAGQRFIEGLGYVSDAREAPKIREMKGIFDHLETNINELVKTAKEGRTILPFQERTSEGRSLATDTMLQLKELANLGVLNGKDLEVLEKLIPQDPTKIFQVNADTKFEEARKLIERKWKSYIGARGLKHGAMQEVEDARSRTK
jgi:hypothetical protein